MLMPFENKKDIEEIPKKTLKKVELILVKHMDEVLKESLITESGAEIFAPKEECKPFRIEDISKVEKESPTDIVTAH